MNKLKIGIVGFGNWGKKIYYVLKNFSDCEVFAICDKKNINLDEKIIVTDDYKDLIRMKLDTVIIATPNETHYEIAHKFLLSDINLFVEKPLATSYKEALSLINLARKKNLNLFTGHILLYHPLIWRFKRYLNEYKNWQLKIRRTNNFLNSSDPKNILYDLGPHEVSLILFLFSKEFDKIDLKVEKKIINFNFSVSKEIEISGRWGENQEEKERMIIAKSDGKEIILDDNLAILKFLEKREERVVEKINKKLPLYWELRFFLNSLINKNIKEIIPTEKVMKIIDKIEKML
ncbi:MAG: Gfo/Idh/MocA family oxidoreductase [candidate division WOR-3 bacterium]